MYNLVLALHIIVSILLIGVILIQRGRGGGLVEALAGAESLFGTKTSSFLVRTTTVLVVLFFITSTTLAFLSKQRGLSLLEKKTSLEEKTTPLKESFTSEESKKPQEETKGEKNSSPGRSSQDSKEELPKSQ